MHVAPNIERQQFNILSFEMTSLLASSNQHLQERVCFGTILPLILVQMAVQWRLLHKHDMVVFRVFSGKSHVFPTQRNQLLERVSNGYNFSNVFIECFERL